ncbi:Lipopolysaccharide core biosynthesis protein RfaG [Planctomycetes bacterium Poly30]|uniref:Lipopolysaccharide core biosynthesis protein RfaG n=1 Tax=Saltatorellus ferox TaxID=2528018 RepID=A0A518EQB1_9BACT|nr:Lipopolysaccharide core biosynthesis protein RfaG [Planctomycetes bacterium Poly30]
MSPSHKTSRAPRSLHIALALLRYFPHGGLQRIAYDTAEALLRRGHRVTLFVREWEGPMPASDAGQPTLNVEVLTVPGVSNHARAARFGRALQERLSRAGADVVLGFDRLPGLDLHFCADPCFRARLRRDRGALHRWTPRARTFLAMERGVFGPESETHILLMNGAEQAVIQSEYGTPSARFTALPPGYSATRRRDGRARELRAAVRAELGLGGAGGPGEKQEALEAGEEAFLLLALGSDFHRKGFDRAVAALPDLRAALPGRRVVLVVAGSGDPARLRRQAKELGVSDLLHCLGARDDVPALLQAADVLVHPCRSEPAGMVLLEALSAGTPVVVSACAGYAHHVSAAKAGVVLGEPFQPAELTHALHELGAAPLEPIRQRALAYMETRDPDAMVDAVIREVERA